MPRILACVAALSFVLAACGGDDGGSDPAAEPYIEAAAASIQADNEGGFAVDDETATCIARAVVDSLGVEAFEEAEVTPEDVEAAEEFSELGIEVDEEMVASIGEKLGGCPLADVLLAGMTSQLGDLSDEDAECLASNMDNAEIGESMAQGILGEQDGQEAAAPIFEAMGECPNALGAVILQSIEDNTGSPVDEETAACIQDYVAENSDAVVDLMTGTGDEAAFEADLESTCGASLSG